ncbi:hypothetical protein H8356DRAFT_929991 [Neocallimastix lanati (nom. inval.)]|nr:hypothetical protein H8356DRAFT_929991 [Neocallimastix sp. JGI-2020a]
MEVNDFYSKTENELIQIAGSSKTNGIIIFLKTNISSRIRNIHLCNINNSCENVKDSSKGYYNTDLIYVSKEGTLEITDTVFDNAYGNKAINIIEQSQMKFNNVTFSNSYFEDGLFMVNFNDINYSYYDIENSHFKNLTSINGSVLDIVNLDDITEDYIIEFKNSIFENNSALKFGGVVFSLSSYTKKHVSFQNCEFRNNHAMNGHISFSLNNKDSEPNFSNIKDLKEIPGLLSTNPTKLKLSEDLLERISLFSGDRIPEGISCKLYDDYDSEVYLGLDNSHMSLNNIFSYEVEVDDTYNTELIGQTQSFCFNDLCTFPSVKGEYYPFENNYINLDFEIKNCTNDYLFQNIESTTFKSCYKPTCNPLCKNNGECININICKCTNHYTGSICDERFKMERIKIIDYLMRIIEIFLSIVSASFIIAIILFKKEKNIKAASIDFLIIILVGLIGFVLVFGSITLKTLRIYRIFCYKKSTKRTIDYRVMYSILFCFVFLYVVVTGIYYIFDKIKLSAALTTDYKEFNKCEFPKSQRVCDLINYSVLMVGCYLSYSIRNINSKFKEDLVVPVYVYVLCVIISWLIRTTDISLIVQDFFGGVGTILSTIVILIYIYIFKFIAIYYKRKIEEASASNSTNLKSNQNSNSNMLLNQNLSNSNTLLNQNMINSNKLYKQNISNSNMTSN